MGWSGGYERDTDRRREGHDGEDSVCPTSTSASPDRGALVSLVVIQLQSRLGRPSFDVHRPLGPPWRLNKSIFIFHTHGEFRIAQRHRVVKPHGDEWWKAGERLLVRVGGKRGIYSSRNRTASLSVEHRARLVPSSRAEHWDAPGVVDSRRIQGQADGAGRVSGKLVEGDRLVETRESGVSVSRGFYAVGEGR